MKLQYGFLFVAALIPLIYARSIQDVDIPGAPEGILCGGTVPKGGGPAASKCYGKLGCVNFTDEWFNVPYRPWNFFPLERADVNTNFLLFTRDGPADGEAVTADEPATIKTSHFNAKDPIVFIVHGFIDDGNTPWLKQLAKAIITYHGPANVFRVDWGAGSYPPYFCAVANTRLVGLEMGYFANVLISQFGATPDQMHVIGHSLGAHVAAYTADLVPGKKLGMATGLDPAGPYYHEMPRSVRLDYTDAHFVQAIHTDSSPIWTVALGMKDPSGHVDFFPNNGQYQPGCKSWNIPVIDITKGLIPAFRATFACSHLRSIALYQDAFVTGCPYVGYECTDYATFTNGQCFDCGSDNTHCAEMGWEAANFGKTGRKEVAMYFETGKDASYSKYHYHVRVTLAQPSNAYKWLRGTLSLSSLQGSLRKISDILITQSKEKFYHGQSYDFLWVTDMNAGQISSVDLEWDWERDTLDPCVPILCNSHLYVASVDVSILNHYPESNLEKFTSHLKPADGSTYAGISSGDTGSFSKS